MSRIRWKSWALSACCAALTFAAVWLLGRPDASHDAAAPPHAAVAVPQAERLPSPITAPPATEQKREHADELRLRVVSITMSPDEPADSRASLQDLGRFGVYVVKEGETIPTYEGVTVSAIDAERVTILDKGRKLVLTLDRRAAIPDPEVTDADYANVAETFVALADQGKLYDGLIMGLWANIGRREQKSLMVQAHVYPDYGGKRGPNKPMAGLRIDDIWVGSFWDQLGVRNGDVIEEVNGRKVDSFQAWKEAMPTLQDETSVTVRVNRDGKPITYRSETVPPR